VRVAYTHSFGRPDGHVTCRTVVAEYPRLGTVQQAVYGRVIKYWACPRFAGTKAIEFDTEAMAVAYLHRKVFTTDAEGVAGKRKGRET